jgi:hypothetical protein
MSKPTLYTFGASVWAAGLYPLNERVQCLTPLRQSLNSLCETRVFGFQFRVLISRRPYSAQLYPEGAIEIKVINLLEGENFDPSFIKLNPNATLPTLEAEGKVYTSTSAVVSYLCKHAPNPVALKDESVIELVHEGIAWLSSDNVYINIAKARFDPNFALLLAVSSIRYKKKLRLTVYLTSEMIKK